MVVYNFKKMAPVPPADDFVDIILTRTQVRGLQRGAVSSDLQHGKRIDDSFLYRERADVRLVVRCMQRVH